MRSATSAATWPSGAKAPPKRPLLAALSVGAPVALAVAAAWGLDRPILGAALLGALVMVAAAVRFTRVHGWLGLWVAALLFSVLAGELSAVSFGGQNGRLLWIDLVLGAGTIASLVRGRLKLAFPRAPVVSALGPFLAWSALTLLMARDLLTGVAELKEWVVAAAVGGVAASFAGDPRRARVLLVLIGVTGSLIALFMFVTAMRSPFGWVLAVLLKKVDLPWGRTNYLAGLLILAIPLTLGLLARASGWVSRAVWLALLMTQSLGLALSASKGAFLALTAGLLVAYVPAGRASRVGVAVMAAIIGLGVALFAWGPLQQVLQYRLQESALDYSVGERMALYRLAWEAFLKSPIWGVGLNNFSVLSNRLTGVDTVPHNLELGLLAELGIPGLLLAFVWLSALARGFWRARSAPKSARERSLGLGLWAAFVAFAIHNQMESTLYGEQYKVLLVMAAAAAWGLGEMAPSLEEEHTAGRLGPAG